MSKKSRITLSVVFVLVTGLACKKVIQVDLNDAAAQIVIEGNVTNQPGPYSVRITKSVSFSASNAYPPVSGASVHITDSTNGMVVILKEGDSGVYMTNSFTGIPRHTYLLQVITGGQTYRASSTMPRPVPLDSISFAINTDFNNKKDINAVVNFQDPVGLGNYYQFAEILNRRKLPDIFVFEDRLSDGKYIQQPLFNDSTYLQRGDTLVLSMYNVDKNIYEYFFTLTNVTGNSGFSSSTPANPISNISNGALGYFSAHTVTSRSLIIY